MVVTAMTTDLALYKVFPGHCHPLRELGFYSTYFIGEETEAWRGYDLAQGDLLANKQSMDLNPGSLTPHPSHHSFRELVPASFI